MDIAAFPSLVARTADSGEMTELSLSRAHAMGWVYHFSPGYTSTRQESPGVLRAEGNLLHRGSAGHKVPGGDSAGPISASSPHRIHLLVGGETPLNAKSIGCVY
jgi:hypothetical protein